MNLIPCQLILQSCTSYGSKKSILPCTDYTKCIKKPCKCLYSHGPVVVRNRSMLLDSAGITEVTFIKCFLKKQKIKNKVFGWAALPTKKVWIHQCYVLTLPCHVICVSKNLVKNMPAKLLSCLFPCKRRGNIAMLLLLAKW